jgi:CRISPR system Cascade subunit CasD
MPTLLLQCVAPLQAWDTQSNFGVRTTGREPSKSGVIGLLCAALGRPRWEAVDDLAELRMGVRVDQEGHILRDWHTAGVDGYLKAEGSVERTNVITSTRYYLTDAAFLVGLESVDLVLLQRLHDALNHPRWMLSLGRKSCPPAAPPYLQDGLQESDLRPALVNYPWLSRNRRRYDELKDANPRGLRLALEDRDHGSLVRRDYPISFAEGDRRFAPRRVSTTWVDWPAFMLEAT